MAEWNMDVEMRHLQWSESGYWLIVNGYWLAVVG